MSSQPLDLGIGSYVIPSPSEKPVPYIAIAFLFVAFLYAISDRGMNLPEANPLKPFEITNQRRLTQFMHHSKEMFLRAATTFGKNPYLLYSEWGSSVVLPPEFMNELRNDPRLEFNDLAIDDSHGYLPGFEPFGGENEMGPVVMKYLTKALTKVTKPMSEETTKALKEIFTDNKEWHEIVPKDDIIRIVNAMSTRVFMGEDLCHDAEWINAASEYTTAGFTVGSELGYYPRWTRPYIHWFLPSCWRVRKLLVKCQNVLRPHLERRKIQMAQGAVFDDSLNWFEQAYTKKYDPANEQITLSLVAIHITSDLLHTVLIDLACH